jgi:uncharacterized protein YceK
MADGIKGVIMRKIIVLACILSLLVSAVVLVGCGSGGSSSGTPESVAKAFWAAALKGDSNTSWAMLSKSIQTGLKNKAAWAKSGVTNNPTATVEAGKATITGDTATVSVKIKSGGTEVTTQEVSLVKEGGVWKVEMP